MTDQSQAALSRSFRRNLLAGLAAVGVLVGGLGGWASTTSLTGAVIASGQLVVESETKKVQHSSGGIVGELLVREGAVVKAGDVLLRLDETQIRATLGIITKNLDELRARQAREQAERDGDEAITFPDDLMRRLGEEDVAPLIAGETKLFASRLQARNGQKAQLKGRITQLQQQIEGLSIQAEAKHKETDLIEQELAGVRELWKKQLVPFSRVTSLTRDSTRIDGERGMLVATIAQVKDKIAEIELQILQIDQDLRSEVSKDLSDVRAKISELGERRIAAEDQLRRMELRAPQDGIVHQLTAHTIGGVIQPGEPIMLIVPSSDELAVDAKVAPQEIDQLYVSQAAIVRITAFNLRTTPELLGQVSRVSADVSTDQKTLASYYSIRVKIPNAEIARLEGLKLVPGMPVEVFIQTSERTVLSYIARPFYDQVKRAFREK